MIPKTRIPEISEFMTGYVVNTYSSESSTMDVYIPIIMIDKKSSNVSTPVSVTNIFVSAENIRVTSNVKSRSFISAKVSDVIRFSHYHEVVPMSPSHPHVVTKVVQVYDKLFVKGAKVKVYVPQLDLDQALIVPM